MKLRNLVAMMFAGSLAIVSCKKDDNGGNGGNTNPVITALDCANATFTGTATSGSFYDETATVSYTGGNGAAYTSGTAIASTGVTGLTATLVDGTLTSGNGSVVFLVTGTPASAGTANFAVSLGGQSCSLALTVETPLPHVAKWFYDKVYDSVFCCAATWRANRTLTFIPDSSQLQTLRPNYYVDLKQNNTFTELWFDNTTYNGSYAIGADSLRFTYSGGGIQRNRVITLDATQLVFADRSTVYLSSPYAEQPGDTLVSRLVWYMKK